MYVKNADISGNRDKKGDKCICQLTMIMQNQSIQKPPLPKHDLTSRVSEIFELINTEKNNV